MKATEIQVGGNHYKKLKMQPIELIVMLRCSFIQGCIIKYVSRYRNKNGEEDIKKCIHYARLALELNDKRKCNDKVLSMAINQYVIKNNLSVLQRKIITQAVYNNYENVINYCQDLLKEQYPAFV